MPSEWQCGYFVACWHTRRYKSLEGFSIYAKAFDMCYRTRYALKRAWWWEKCKFSFLLLFVRHRGETPHTVIQSVSEESPGKDTDLWWSLRCKWSFPTESEVCLWQVKFHLWWSYGGKSIYFFVYRCSYHKLGDLSTTLEMTVLFL